MLGENTNDENKEVKTPVEGEATAEEKAPVEGEGTEAPAESNQLSHRADTDNKINVRSNVKVNPFILKI